MSAQQAYLEDWLQEAVISGAISLSEAWALQDVAFLVPPGERQELPPEFEPMMHRLWLLEARPANRLPA
jgi:hypothetical protein